MSNIAHIARSSDLERWGLIAIFGVDTKPIHFAKRIPRALKHLNPGQNIIKCVRTANEHSRQASIVAAENVSGVTKVHDHLCWVEPMSGMYLNSPEDDSLLKAH